jgi:transposase-like protein
MRVMSQSPDPLARVHTMTKRQGKTGTIDVKAVLAEDEEFLRALVRTALQEVLEAEMTEALGAEKGERASGRQGYRSGYYGRTLVTRVGKLELRVPQDRAGRFSTELFERYQRSERALVAALAEMYVQGVSTRKVKAITEELCGHSFSASSISAMNQRLDDSLAQFAGRSLAEAFPYLILDARYERVREAGVIVSQAVLIAIGIDWDGRRQVLAIELANRESRSSWRRWTRLAGLAPLIMSGTSEPDRSSGSACRGRSSTRWPITPATTSHSTLTGRCSRPSQARCCSGFASACPKPCSVAMSGIMSIC